MKGSCRCLKMWGTGEQWGYRKVCTALQGAVGLVSPRGQQWEGVGFRLKEVHRAGDRHLYDGDAHCVPSLAQMYRKRRLLPGKTHEP